ncbi:class I mannose-6-phosphate isomerase [Puniceicoccus vermicola]|uniref:Phosphohexomutase n=1 Tax=Puniceicoccus vermicola TaxID=388746 RepID=A0A7X1AUV3_9BACT|nr:mannose-6-phosphate isomerase [Puniceicoccus vermicola]MBC2600242.1 mannose-6-phosphate isomerase [Puniceicoccus vermicola]
MNICLPAFLEILPNRVRRNYCGGALLEQWTGEGSEGDSQRPEDWIASTVNAVNPGLPAVNNEGLTYVRLPNREIVRLSDLLATAPHHYLGAEHVNTYGLELGFLAKLLDSAMRLHVQAHPTSAFAQEKLNSRYGKFETYVVLAIRKGMNPYLRLGFQHAPSRDDWRRIIEEQDIPSMDACFDPIPLKVGEVWRVPGGLPHAIGEGALVLEVMEPSDWVVRCEFEREGIVVPPEGRFMRRELDFCLDVFDYTERTVEEIKQLCRLSPKLLLKTDALIVEQLIGPQHTDCFNVRRLIASKATLPAYERMALYLVSKGEGILEAGDGQLTLRPGSRFFLPVGGSPVRLQATSDCPIEFLVCLPT